MSKTKAQLSAELECITAELEALKSVNVGGVIAQVKQALTVSWVATLVGGALGSFVPVAIWWLVHHDLSKDVWKPSLVLVLGGLAFSAKTVYQWTRQAFACPWKAAGFTVLCEGVLTFSESEWLSLTALAYLAIINAVATGATLATER